MSEDTTQRFDGRSFEERIFARLEAMELRFDARISTLAEKVDRLEEKFDRLDEKVDRRLMETRPIWQAMQATLEDMNSQLIEVLRELLATRGRVQRLEERQRTPAA